MKKEVKEIDKSIDELKKILKDMNEIKEVFNEYFKETNEHAKAIMQIVDYLKNNKKDILHLAGRIEKVENQRRADEDVSVV